jgi:hypothetical protein
MVGRFQEIRHFCLWSGRSRPHHFRRHAGGTSRSAARRRWLRGGRGRRHVVVGGIVDRCRRTARVLVIDVPCSTDFNEGPAQAGRAETEVFVDVRRQARLRDESDGQRALVLTATQGSRASSRARKRRRVDTRAQPLGHGTGRDEITGRRAEAGGGAGQRLDRGHRIRSSCANDGDRSRRWGWGWGRGRRYGTGWACRGSATRRQHRGGHYRHEPRAPRYRGDTGEPPIGTHRGKVSSLGDTRAAIRMSPLDS